ncbi:MAG: hypothetical protein EOS21_29735 [Mesorhizobium sp.]|nr:MAG: hypothetical protein EOS21_29735 [Mesorhizobium sp.]
MSAAPFERPARRYITVYDTPSNLGGSFTVSIVETLAGTAVKVRVWYGARRRKAGRRGRIGTATRSRQTAQP